LRIKTKKEGKVTAIKALKMDVVKHPKELVSTETQSAFFPAQSPLKRTKRDSEVTTSSAFQSPARTQASIVPPVIFKGTNDQDRFTDAMNRVTELLKVNQTL